MVEAAPWVVAGRYEVGEVVGTGGYGTVRRAIDRKTGQPVAMKVLSADAGRDPHQVERMLREQQAMLAMAGTCAVTAIDLCRLPSGAPCLVMEWLDGRDLEGLLTEWEAAGQRQSNEILLELMRPLAETLQRAHELGIVHRDIKPANIFLTARSFEPAALAGGVRLLDFGLSRMRSAAPLTAIGMVMGSPSYIPPETWQGNSSLIDHRADLYSLAVIVFRVLAGRLPFETPSLVQKLELVTKGERPSVCQFRPDLPLTVDDWMRRALAIEPNQRFQSGHDFYQALGLALSGMPFAPLEEELSGVREKTSVASVLPTENRNVLSLAWDRATSLLQRFIGQKSSPRASSGTSSNPPAGSTPPPGASTPPSAPPPPAPQSASPAAPEAKPVVEGADAWIDDHDVEALPESRLPAELIAPPAKAEAEAEPRASKARAGSKKKPKNSAKSGKNKVEKLKSGKQTKAKKHKPARKKKR